MSQPSTSKSRIDLNDKLNKEDLLGTLIVVLLKARNLLDKHSFRKSDVFAQAILNGVEKRTHVDVKGGQHPEWDGEVRFPILKSSAANHRKMEIACYSVEPRSKDLMGKATVDISETLRTGEFDDWVQLEVEGVARGELYLEMTYYANSPAPTAAAPNKMLSAVLNQNVGLSRRPSKLSPSERLSRPQPSLPIQGDPQPQRYPKAQEYPQNQPQTNTPANLSTTSNLAFTRPNDHAAHIRNNSTPTMPGAYPESSNGSYKQTQGAQSAQRQQPVPLPTILRPGPVGAASSPTPIPRPQNGHGRHPSEPTFATNATRHPQGSPSNSNPYLGGSASGSQPSTPPHNPYISGTVTPPNPYIVGPGASSSNRPAPAAYSPAAVSHGSVAAQPATAHVSVASPVQNSNPYTGYRLSGQAPAGAPLLWQGNSNISAPSSNVPFSFPQPSIVPGGDPALHGYNDNDPPSHHRTASGGTVPQNLSVSYGQAPPRGADPHLQARYQTPLPLPLDASSSAKTPTPSHQPLQPQHATHSHSPELRAASPPPPPPKTPTPTVDKARLEALRLVEQESVRRREQELKDLELAMQLDREFNLQG